MRSPDHLDLRHFREDKWLLLREVRFWPHRAPQITVPAGFFFDGFSVPRLFWPLFPPHGKGMKAALLHDYLYEYKLLTREHADDLFLEGMVEAGLPEWKRNAMYHAVWTWGNDGKEWNE